MSKTMSDGIQSFILTLPKHTHAKVCNINRPTSRGRYKHISAVGFLELDTSVRTCANRQTVNDNQQLDMTIYGQQKLNYWLKASSSSSFKHDGGDCIEDENVKLVCGKSRKIDALRKNMQQMHFSQGFFFSLIIGLDQRETDRM